MSDATELNALAAQIEDGVVTFARGERGTLTVEGWVGSFDGHRRALAVARRAPGVLRVEDQLMILLARGVRP